MSGVKNLFTISLVYAMEKGTEIKLTRDPVSPLTQGVSDLIDNVQPLCARCHSNIEQQAYRLSITLLHKGSRVCNDTVHSRSRSSNGTCQKRSSTFTLTAFKISIAGGNSILTGG